MKRCTAACAGRLPLARCGVQIQPRRWRSYDKSALTQDALLEQVESQLGNDPDGNPLRVDPDAKTVMTAAGALPISPIMDPAWMKARRRQRKNEPGKISGQFRKKLANNPFADALMTPLRKCFNTDSYLPRYFLQDFEVINNPKKPNQTWLAPGTYSFDSVVPVYQSGPWSPTGQAHTDTRNVESKETQPLSESTAGGLKSEANAIETPFPETKTLQNSHTVPIRQKQSPLTTYCLSRKGVLDAISGGPNSKKTDRRLLARMLALRHGMAATTVELKNSVWRTDMGDFVLGQLRRTAGDALIYRANRSTQPKFHFLQPVDSWERVKDIDQRGCVLWFSDKIDPIADSFATLDIEGAQWWSKMPVHNMAWLLGEQEVERIRSSSEIFRDNNLVVLKLWKSESMRKLHLILWRLQGYLAEIKREEAYKE